MTPEKLQEILAAHKLWLNTDGEQGQRAYLTDAYLTDAYLTGADLTDANHTDAYLTGADLTGALTSGARKVSCALKARETDPATLSNTRPPSWLKLAASGATSTPSANAHETKISLTTCTSQTAPKPY